MPRPGTPCEHGLICHTPCVNKRRRDKYVKTQPLRTVPPEQRLAALTDKTPGHGPNGDCWIYLGRKTKGYGILSRNNKKVYAHRLAYEIEHGSLDPEVDVCHKCDFPPCVRPDHLFAGDARANIVDMVSKGRHWLQNRPEDGLTAKLSWDEVREIRRLRKSGATRSEVATKFGVTVWTISDITGKSTWKEKENDSLNTAIETIDLSDDGMSAIVQLDTHSGLETS